MPNKNIVLVGGAVVVVLAAIGAFLVLKPVGLLPTGANNQNPAANQGGVKYSAMDCELLNGADVKSVLNSYDVTEQPISKSEGQCSKGWVTKDERGVPGNSVVLTVTETKVNPYYSGFDPSTPLKNLCGQSASLNLGQYTSCNFMGAAVFGKGEYMVQVSCIGCDQAKTEQLAKLAEGRM